jgi:hypothetical protein
MSKSITALESKRADPSNRAADGALEVSGYVMPIPGRRFGKSKPAVVRAAAVIAARKLCRPHAIGQRGVEAGLLIDGTSARGDG